VSTLRILDKNKMLYINNLETAATCIKFNISHEDMIPLEIRWDKEAKDYMSRDRFKSKQKVGGLSERTSSQHSGISVRGLYI